MGAIVDSLEVIDYIQNKKMFVRESFEVQI
jgi:hypothetical protein